METFVDPVQTEPGNTFSDLNSDVKGLIFNLLPNKCLAVAQLVCKAFLVDVWKLQRSFVLDGQEWKSFSALGRMTKLESLKVPFAAQRLYPPPRIRGVTIGRIIGDSPPLQDNAEQIFSVAALTRHIGSLGQLRRLTICEASRDFLIAAFGQDGNHGPLRQLEYLDMNWPLQEQEPVPFVQLAKAIVCTSPLIRILKMAPRLAHTAEDTTVFETLSALEHIEKLELRHQVHSDATWESMRKCKKFKFLKCHGGLRAIEQRILADDLGFVVLHEHSAYIPSEEPDRISLLNSYLSHNLRLSHSEVMNYVRMANYLGCQELKHPFIVASLRESTKRLHCDVRNLSSPEMFTTLLSVLAAASHSDPSCSAALLDLSSKQVKNQGSLDSRLVSPLLPHIRDYLQRVLARDCISGRGFRRAFIEETLARFPSLLDDDFHFRCHAAGTDLSFLT
eukprot:TRINITY_DN3935_c0_g1_i1.p1 TRINITY_DN3935_c0_g1~~TRINITY_DN3935_c0_g1_i1.p1  ORF type:complete len:448 (+),score=30.24 TRINITY_DN3935_c0_g1_i1:102-1445(+)